MLTWSIQELARKAKISDSSIRRIEASFGVPDNVTLDLLTKLQEYFESRGFIFSWADEAGPGVHWPRYPGRFKPGDRRQAAP
jgi:transcriptional regulator with XRE-family HTH domain